MVPAAQKAKFWCQEQNPRQSQRQGTASGCSKGGLDWRAGNISHPKKGNKSLARLPRECPALQGLRSPWGHRAGLGMGLVILGIDFSVAQGCWSGAQPRLGRDGNQAGNNELLMGAIKGEPRSVHKCCGIMTAPRKNLMEQHNWGVAGLLQHRHSGGSDFLVSIF